MRSWTTRVAASDPLAAEPSRLRAFVTALPTVDADDEDAVATGDRRHPVDDELDAVGRHLGATGGHQVGGGAPSRVRNAWDASTT